jgi:16S rRNA (guanine966-N2)-methyltransferase
LESGKRDLEKRRVSSPRIIAGKARGMRLKDVPGDITRPITDRVKEALFNILGSDIQDSSLLDLFGGTGSVGIEALSRGAAYVRFTDLNRPAVDTIRANLKTTRLEDLAQVIQSDAFHYLKQAPDRIFDYIFIAPPQYKGLWIKALQVLNEQPGWLAENGWIIVQIDPVEYVASNFESFTEFEQRRYGSTLLVFFEIPETSTETHD